MKDEIKLDLKKVLTDDFEGISQKMVGAQKLLFQAEFLCEQGLTYVGRQNGEPFLLMGVFPLWTGVAEAWVLHREGYKSVPVFTLRAFRKVIKESFEKLNLHRLQIDFNLTDHEEFGMSKAAGFQPEGTMRCFTYDKKDCLRMAIIREGSCQ